MLLANLGGVIRAGIVAIALALLGASSAQALTLEQLGGSFAEPTYVTSDPGDANRLFVVERKGTIQLVANGIRSKFADLNSQVGCGAVCTGERGLMSIAFDPEFDANGRLYVDYGSEVDGEIHIDELVSAGPAHNSAVFARNLLSIPHPTQPNHYGGQLQVGPDGALYISTGDGGGENDLFQNAQSPSSKLGKILRLDPDDAPGSEQIWSLGLRNPFRFSFDRLSGDMVIGDVGQKLREEVDVAPSPSPGVVGGEGFNYGWNCREGLLPGPATDPECALLPADADIPPAFDYPHTPDPDLGGSNRCSIIGGYVVRDPGLGALYGRYIYADLCSGGIRALQLPTAAGGRAVEDCSLGLALDRPVSFGEDAARRLYVVEQGGRVYHLAGLPPATCPPPLLLPPSGEDRPQAKSTIIGIKAQRRRVERGKAALLTVFVSPCEGRRGQSVELLRNGRVNGSRYLSRACTARFLPRVRRGTTFAAKIREGRGYEAGVSRRLTIRLAHRKHHH
jgi:hypothetical protein